MKKIFLLSLSIALSLTKINAQDIKLTTSSSPLCEGVNIPISASNIPANATLLWQKDRIDIPNAITTTYTTSSAGSYSVQALGASRWVTKSPEIKYPTLRSVFSVNAKVSYAVGDDGEIVKTSDGGVTWQKQYPRILNHWDSVFFTDELNGWAVGESTLNQIIKTNDGGETWVQVPKTWQDSYYFSRVFFLNSKIGWITSGSVILKTVDGGVSWKSMLQTGPYIGAYAVFFTDANTGWAADYFGAILKTTDGGATWKESYNVNTTSGQQSGYFHDINFINSNVGWAVGTNGLMVTTNDGGLSWSRKTGVNDDLWLNSIVFADANVGWALPLLFPSQYLFTTDGGKTWVKKNFTPNFAHVKSSVKDNKIISVGGNGQIITGAATSDTWIKRRGNFDVYNSVFFTDKYTGYRDSNLGVIEKTTDGGSTWITLNSNTTDNLGKIKFVDSNTGWVQNEDNTYNLKTTDAGKTWVKQSTTIIPRYKYFSFLDTQNGFAVGAKNTVAQTTNGGESWSLLKTPLDTLGYLNDLHFIDTQNGWIVGSAGTVIKTKDGGKSWTSINLGAEYKTQSLRIVKFLNATTGWIVTTTGSILRTSDGGTTWNLLPTNNMSSPKGLYIVDANTLFYSNMYSQLYKSVDGGISWVSVDYNANTISDLFVYNPQAIWIVGYANTMVKYEAPVIATSNTITINPKPVAPTLTWNNADGKISSTNVVNGGSLVWFKDKQLITNASSTTLQPISSGVYVVKVTDTNGCSQESNSISVNILASENPLSSDIKLYPNPNEGVFNLEMNFIENYKEAIVNIVNLNGQNSFHTSEKINDGTLKTQISVKELPKGIYFLRITAGDKTSTIKIIIN
jgi:photosystem II stability/assembly factor-like uncharacterized protein